MRYMAFLSVLLGVFLDNLLFNVLIPVLPFYAEVLHLSHTQLGWLISSYTLALLCTVFFSGILTDKYGPSKNFMLGSGLLVIAVFLLKISVSYEWMIFARALQGISAGFTWVAGFSYVAKFSPPEKVGRNLILVQSGMGFAEFTGPVIGGFLYERGGADLLFKTLLALSALNLLLRIFVWNDRETVVGPASRIDLSPLKDRKILRLSLIYLCGGFLLSLADPILPVFLKHQYGLTESKVSLAFLVITTAYYVFALPVTALSKSPLLIYAGIFLSSISLVFIFVPYENLFWLFGALSVFGFATGIFIIPVVSRIAAAVAETRSDSYGVAFSSGQWAYTLGMFIGPIASTGLAEFFPYLHIAVILSTLPVVLLIALRKI